MDIEKNIKSSDISLPVEEYKDEKLILKGLTICDSCKKIVEGEIFIKNGDTYLRKYCDIENKKMCSLLFKGEYSIYNEVIDIYKNPRLMVKKGENGSSFFDFSKLTNKKYLSSVILFLTAKCNANCKFCPNKIGTDKYDLKISKIRSILKELKNNYVMLYGGEPTLRKDIFEIIKMVKATGNFPAITTNGLKLDSRNYVRKMKKAGLGHVYLSFDGFSKKNYVRIRGNTLEYYKKLKAIANLKKERVKTVFYSTIIGGINESQIMKLLNYMKDNKFVIGLGFRPLTLIKEENYGNLEYRNVLSREQIIEKITDAIKIDKDYFYIFDEFKRALIAFKKKKCSWLNLPQIRSGRIYLIRKRGNLKPLLSKKLLIKLIEFLNGYSWRALIKSPILFNVIPLFVRFLFSTWSVFDNSFLNNGILKVEVGHFRLLRNHIVSRDISYYRQEILDPRLLGVFGSL